MAPPMQLKLKKLISGTHSGQVFVGSITPAPAALDFPLVVTLIQSSEGTVPVVYLLP